MIPSTPLEKPGAGPGQLARPPLSTGLAVAVLAGIALAFYHGLWLPDLVLIKRDAFRFFLPLRQYLYERLAAGELPQWFPYEGLGRSFIGVTHTGVFHPFTSLHLIFSVPDAYRAATLLSCLLAALGAFALGRTLHVSRAGALLSGIAFALSGYVVSLTDNLLYLYSMCALPLFCAALEQALVKARAWAVAPAAIWATVLLIGDIQTGYYYLLIAALWTAARAPGPRREACLRLTLIVGLSALLAAIQLGPSWVAFAASERAHPALFLEQALQWSTSPLRLATVLASPVGEDADPVGVARLFFDSPAAGLWAESLYLGVPMTGLALLGAWRRRDLKVFVVLGGLALLLALGRFGGLYEIVYPIVPLWSAFRYPEKLMGIVSFTAAMLAGAGLDALRARPRPVLPWLAMAVLCAAAGFGLRTDAAGAWATGHFQAPASLAHEVSRSAGLAFLSSAVAAFGVWLIVAGARRQGMRGTPAVPFLIMLVTLDLARANLGAYHTGPVEAATFTPPFADAIKAREGALAPGRFRLVSIHEEILVGPPHLLRPLGYHGAGSVERRQALDHEHNAQFRLESALPYLSGYSTRFAETLNPRSGIEAAARLNVAYYIGRRYHLKDPRFAQALVAQLPPYDLALFTNPVPAKPRAYLSLKPERTTTPADPTALHARPDFMSGEVDVIETATATVPGPAQGGLAVIERYDPENVRVRVETPQPAALILLDAYEKGWTATLDGGAELPILRANALVRAVVVPAGTHVVTFSYQTPLLKAGAWASLAGGLLCLGLIMHAQRRGRRTEDRA